MDPSSLGCTLAAHACVALGHPGGLSSSIPTRPSILSPEALLNDGVPPPSQGVTLTPCEPWIPLRLGGSASAEHAAAPPRAGASLRGGFLGAVLAGADEVAPGADPRGVDAATASSAAHGDGHAGLSTEALARLSQNPVANLVSVPFQYNANFGFGPDDDVQSVLNIQPVIPFTLSDQWNLITRTILPVIYQPTAYPGGSDDFGIGDITFTTFFSPQADEGFIWGAGPAFLVPTATSSALGQGKFGIGPSVVGLYIKGPWVVGALANNIWSVAGSEGRPDVNQFLVQPFVNYNLPGGWFLTSSPIITANWEADSDQRWTLPIGGGFGRIFHLGRLPLNMSLQGYWNAERPDPVGEWTLRFQVSLLFPR